VKIVSAAEHARIAQYLRGSWHAPEGVAEEVAAILSGVRARGDAALVDYTRRFDCDGYDISKLRVPIAMQIGARELVSAEVARAMETAKERVARFHGRQRPADLTYAEEDGSKYALLHRSLDSVVVYAPGGSASLASSVLMGAVPAKIAGVKRVIVLTPPQDDGYVNPAVRFACSLCEVDELYAVGGAQAIAAAAFGTESIRPVEKIVGPGGVWVTEAKRQVFGLCGIDMLAGPAEVLVVADEGANSEYVAGELLAQAEADSRARVAVVSESRSLLEAVAQLLDTIGVKTLPRGDIIGDVFDHSCHLIHATSREEIFAVIDRFAPAHLGLQVRDADAYLPHIRNAGAVFVGDLTPLVCGDAMAGSSHVLPTSGTARFSSGLSLATFMRTFAVVENSAERMTNDAAAIVELAELEGLPQRAQTARMRTGG
jgi:histidinol dehydrogenase